MRITARSAVAAVVTVLVFAACSSSNDDGGSSSSGGFGDGGVASDGAIVLDDGGIAACGHATTLCPDGQQCTAADDCTSGFCQDICTEPSHVNGIKDDGETGIDCGGTAPKKCPPGQGCASNADCDNTACDPSTKVCLAASHTDMIKNDGETGVDCGGMAPNKCAVGQGCASNTDCDNTACNTMAMPPVCTPPSNMDGIKNGDETGIDCGGPTAPQKCPPGQGCATTADCANTLCNAGLTCDPPSSTDGLKNGTETDIDCGGGAPTNAAKCGIGLACGAADANCASSVCNYASKCVEAPSCRNNHGGDTCGPAGSLESCCISPPVTYGNPATTVHLDKYSITAGRMRTFATDAAVNGNVRDWIINHKPAWWQDAWTAFLPSVMDNGGVGPDGGWSGFYQDVGPNVLTPFGGGNEGCTIRNNGARTYRLPDAINARMNDEQDYTQDFLDERSMNCVTVYILAAFCAWDGAKLASVADLNGAWERSTKLYPWGNPTRQRSPNGGSDPGIGNPAGYTYASVTDPKGAFGFEAYGEFYQDPKVAAPFNPNPDELWANYSFNYWGNGVDQATSKTCNGHVGTAYGCDQSSFIAQPGRFPNGNSASGHADLAGNVFNATSNFSGTSTQWSQNGSWEGHAIPYGNHSFPGTNKYLAMGGRCVRP